MSQKRKASPTLLTSSPTTFHSTRIHDRTSTFIAAYSPALSAEALQQSRDFSSASHRVAAWRKPSKQRSIAGRALYETGHDDDGEQYAGKRLEKVLEEMQVEGAVVVARWYGGVMLGPVRFAHIENCARDAIRRSKTGQDDKSGGKRQRIGQQQPQVRDRKELEQILAERDESVKIIRELLAEKLAEGTAKEDDDDTGAVVQASPAKVPDYTKMPIAALERLEKARDATLAWLLQEIDKAEANAELKKSSGAGATHVPDR